MKRLSFVILLLVAVTASAQIKSFQVVTGTAVEKWTLYQKYDQTPISWFDLAYDGGSSDSLFYSFYTRVQSDSTKLRFHSGQSVSFVNYLTVLKYGATETNLSIDGVWIRSSGSSIPFTLQMK